MKIVHIKGQGPELASNSQKKLPMDKDPVFMAGLRSQIIADHNRKIRALSEKIKINQHK